MNRILAISAIAVFAIVMGVSAFAPAMADRATAPGQNKEYICHVEHDDPETPEDESSIDLIKVPTNSAHFKGKHPDDFAPTTNDNGTPDDDTDDFLECVAPVPEEA